MMSLDVGRMIRPPVGFQIPETVRETRNSMETLGSCHRLEVVELRERVRQLEALRDLDAAHIARLEAKLSQVTRDWCQLLVEFSAWAGRIAAPPTDRPEA